MLLIVLVYYFTLYKCDEISKDINIHLADGYTLKGSVRNNSLVFLGVPYASAPINDLRWKAPHAYLHKDISSSFVADKER
jgi:hypothetical protein